MDDEKCIKWGGVLNKLTYFKKSGVKTVFDEFDNFKKLK